MQFSRSLRQISSSLLLRLLPAIILSACSTLPDVEAKKAAVIVSVPDQRLAILRPGRSPKVYRISTGFRGIGDRLGSYATPTGTHVVAQKIGAGAPLGSVFKGGHRTGEVIKPNSPGRDPIVTRIIWLRGLQRQNANAFQRHIYIHGTPEERRLGKPVSWGCIRMSSRDVVSVFDAVRVGTVVQISESPLPAAVASLDSAQRIADAATPPSKTPSKNPHNRPQKRRIAKS
jgi:lipoprotein-anchoring transpeptidase ErfK/SrfK